MSKVLLAGLFLGAISAEAADRIYPGYVKREYYTDNGGGVLVDDLRADPNYPASPSTVNFADVLESGTDFGNNYGGRISGYIVPKETGAYIFHLAADDGAEFWLSTNDQAANLAMIATEPVWANFREYTGSSGGRRAGFDFGAPENVSAPIQLTAGNRYYFEGLWKEGGGGDHYSVTWLRQGGTVPTTPIAGEFLAVTAPDLSITQQPSNVSVAENRPATFTVQTSRTPGVRYQWQANGADIAGATNASFTLNATQADSGKRYRAVVSAAGDQTVNSSEATLTVTGDTTAPKISSVGTFIDLDGVLVQFDEAMNTSTLTAGNFQLSGGATVSSAEVIGNSAVFLKTSKLTANTSYTLTANANVKDAAAGGGNSVSPATATFTSTAGAPGAAFVNAVKYNRWEGVSGGIDGLLAEIEARPPDVDSIVGSYEAPVNVADNYGARLQAYFVPPSTGEYIFFMSSDDPGRLFLSTDSTPANKKLIAIEPTWNPTRTWVSTTRRNATNPENRSDQYQATEWPTGNTINLIGGQKYYMELLFTEGGGGDNGEATFKLAGEPDPANGTPSRITASAVGNFIDVTTAPPIITTRPTGTVFNKGDTVTLNVDAIGAQPITYQWFKNKIAVPGATSKTLTIANADHRAVGDYYAVANNAQGEATTYPDDQARVLMRGAFVIEAEDFNYEGGKFVAAANTMPLAANLYQNLKPTLDIDFFNDGDESGGAAFAYTRFATTDEGVVEMKGPADPADYNRGSYTTTANYAIGWTDIGDWQNYTRTFPQGRYAIFGALAHDGRADAEIDQILSLVARPTAPDNSGIGFEGGGQGLTEIGRFLGPGTGAWSSNDIIPLTNQAGQIAEVNLSGTQTLRLTFNAVDGDADYFLFYNLDAVAAPTIGVARNATGGIVITYTGTLQSAADVTGPYTAVAGASSPHTVTPSDARRFYRVQQ